MKKILLKIFFLLFLNSMVFAQEWTVTGEFSIPSFGAQAVTLNSKIYVLGGYSAVSGQPHPYIQEFDPYSNACQIVDSLTAPRAYFVAEVVGDSILIFSGESDTFEHATHVESWKPGQPSRVLFNHPHLNRIKSTGGVVYNRIVLVGGYTDPAFGDVSIPYVVEYDLANFALVYESTDIIASNLPYDQSSLFEGNYMFLLGGVYNGVSNKHYQLDLDTKEIARTYPDLALARAGGTIVHNKDSAYYLVGGYNESNIAIPHVEKFEFNGYNISANLVEPLKHARKEGAAALVNYDELEDRIYAFGGIDDRNKVLSNIEMLSIQKAITFVENKNANPSFFELFNNYPNPFNSSTSLQFSLKTASRIRLEIVTVDGQIVNTLSEGLYAPGPYKQTWDGLDKDGISVASNMYFYRLITDFGTLTKKMVLIK
jgi:hypothetical protein